MYVYPREWGQQPAASTSKIYMYIYVYMFIYVYKDLDAS